MSKTNWEALRSTIAYRHASAPQRSYLARASLDQIEQAIAELAKLGHTFALVESLDVDEPIEYPKMMYHPEKGEREVANEREAKALGDGWTDRKPGAYYADPTRIEPGQLGNETGIRKTGGNDAFGRPNVDVKPAPVIGHPVNPGTTPNPVSPASAADTTEPSRQQTGLGSVATPRPGDGTP